VISASYHNPLWVAERAVQLDHMTKGRFMLGLGPGALPSDAAMIGLDMPQTRDLLEDAVDIITRLMRWEDPVTFDNGRWTLQDARLHLRPYTHPHPEIAIAAVASPAGPRLAGRYGHGLLSIGATTAAGFDVLGLHWDVMEERAAHYGAHVDRDAWRLVGFMHLAETREQAYRDVEHGILQWFDYFQHTAAFPQMAVGDGTTVRECIDFVNDSGLGAIGTPDDAVAQIERLVKQSNGGFGAYLSVAQDWAAPAAKFRSYELFARHVAPVFQGQAHPTLESKARARAARPVLAESNIKAVEAATAKYEAELKAAKSG
jgi:limonene 1,2-monooxygenase